MAVAKRDIQECNEVKIQRTGILITRQDPKIWEVWATRNRSEKTQGL